MSHFNPRVFRDQVKEMTEVLGVCLHLMQALRLHRTGLLRQLTAPTPGCANRLIHQSAVGK